MTTRRLLSGRICVESAKQENRWVTTKPAKYRNVTADIDYSTALQWLRGIVEYVEDGECVCGAELTCVCCTAKLLRDNWPDVINLLKEDAE